MLETHRILPINVHITKVHHLEWGPSSRIEDFRVLRSSLGKFDSIWVYSRRLTKADEGVAQFSGRLFERRYRSQAVCNYRTLLRYDTFADIVILDL